MTAASAKPSKPAAFDTGQAIVLAGGAGTRLWPLSRTLFPKQLLTLSGPHSLLQQTLLRVLPGFGPERGWVVTNEEHVFEVRSRGSAPWTPGWRPRSWPSPWCATPCPRCSWAWTASWPPPAGRAGFRWPCSPRTTSCRTSRLGWAT